MDMRKHSEIKTIRIYKKMFDWIMVVCFENQCAESIIIEGVKGE